jgi:membrane fusion protein (multidrug efflux system)
MLPPDNATGNFTKVVQRLPVRLHFTAESVRGFEDRLRAGLSAVVDVDVRR